MAKSTKVFLSSIHWEALGLPRAPLEDSVGFKYYFPLRETRIFKRIDWLQVRTRQLSEL